MGIENGDDSLNPHHSDAIRKLLSRWELDIDARNVFARLDFAVFAGKSGKQFSVSPLPRYRDYLTQRAGTPPEEVELTMSLSDLQAVAAFDRVVDEFNTDIDRINREQDFEAVRRFEISGFDIFKQRS